MQLSCPEFRLRGLPRIPVRGQMVQGGRVLLRKAPLPSRVYPWSTRRHCGPLAFRCATEGSRSAKEGEGSQEGTSTHLIRARRGKEDSGLRPKPYLVSCPLLFPPVNTGSPPGDPGNPPAVGTASPPPDGGSPCRRRRQFLAGEHRRFPRRRAAAIPSLHLLGNPL